MRFPSAFAALALLGASALPAAQTAAQTAGAQSFDTSPTLLLESGPSDTPGYRRMVLVHYLDGPNVNVSYRALNRSEFTQAPGSANLQVVADCARGPATTLREIDAFQRAEGQRARSGQAPEVVRFCVKGVPGWKAGAQKRWLDPIFEGMPYAATLK